MTTTPSHPKISICITCMDRFEQLRSCLKDNLLELSHFSSSELEVVLVLFLHPEKDDENRLIDRWIRRTFPRFIRSGLLKYYVSNQLYSWHASIAKNTSHRLSRGEFIVNLDCDNWISSDEVYYLLNNLKKFKKNGNDRFIYHGWSGMFHDGTYGRIGLYRKDFITLGGYDESFLPMGSQDMDLLTRASHYFDQWSKIPAKNKSKAIHNSKTVSLGNVVFDFIKETSNNSNNSNNLIEDDDISTHQDFSEWTPDIIQQDEVREDTTLEAIIEDTTTLEAVREDTTTLEEVREDTTKDRQTPNYYINSNFSYVPESQPTIEVRDNIRGYQSIITSSSNYLSGASQEQTPHGSQSSPWDAVHNILSDTMSQIQNVDRIFQNQSIASSSNSSNSSNSNLSSSSDFSSTVELHDLSNNNTHLNIDNLAANSLEINYYISSQELVPYRAQIIFPKNSHEVTNFNRLQNDVTFNDKWKRMEGINRRRIYQKVRTENFIISPPYFGVSAIRLDLNHLTYSYDQMIKLLTTRIIQNPTKPLFGLDVEEI